MKRPPGHIPTDVAIRLCHKWCARGMLRQQRQAAAGLYYLAGTLERGSYGRALLAQAAELVARRDPDVTELAELEELAR